MVSNAVQMMSVMTYTITPRVRATYAGQGPVVCAQL